MTETAFIGYPFLIETKHFGTHIGKKGYGVRDYSIMTGKEYVRFDCAVFTEEEKKPVEPGTWILFDGQTEFYIPSGTKEGVYEMTILTVAKNCPPESEMREDYTEDTANLDRRHYIAKTTQSFQIRNLVTMSSGVVVGTH